MSKLPDYFECLGSKESLLRYRKRIKSVSERLNDPGFMTLRQYTRFAKYAGFLLESLYAKWQPENLSYRQAVQRMLSTFGWGNSFNFCLECGSVFLYKPSKLGQTLRPEWAQSSQHCKHCFETWYSSGRHILNSQTSQWSSDRNFREWNARVDLRQRFPKNHGDGGTALFMGVELEVEPGRLCPQDIVTRLSRCFQNFAIMKQDGSLHYGFEIVTIPCTYLYHKFGAVGNNPVNSPWHEFFDVHAKHLRSWQTDTCGLHVHVSRKGITPLTAHKLYKFMGSQSLDIKKFLYELAGRVPNPYCQVIPQEQTRPLGFLRSGSRYHVLNNCNEHTLEFRLFRGNCRKNGFFRVLDFVHAVIMYCRDAGVQTIGLDGFVQFVQKNYMVYPHLTAWMYKMRYVVDKKMEYPKFLGAETLARNGGATVVYPREIS